MSASPGDATGSVIPAKVKGHVRHETALRHGLTTTEVQSLSEACIEAKSRAYCKSYPQSARMKEDLRESFRGAVQVHTPTLESAPPSS